MTPQSVLRGVKTTSRWCDRKPCPAASGDPEAPHGLKGASEEWSICSPHPPSSPSRKNSILTYPGTGHLYTARSQPGPLRAASKDRAAKPGFSWGKGERQCPIPRLKPTQAGQLLPVCLLAQVHMAEQRPRCWPQGPQAGLSGPHLSTPTWESSLGKDTECLREGVRCARRDT